MVGSDGSEIRCRVQEHKPALLNPNHDRIQLRKHGLANLTASLMGAWDDRKVTSGITELSRLRVHIDGASCHIDVGSSYPGRAAASKGTGVHRLKGMLAGFTTL